MRAYTSKTKDSFVTALENTISHFEDFGHKVKAFRSDSEQIMKWGPVKQVLESKGIQPQHSLPYAHYQNLAERYVQTVVKAVSTNLHGQSLLRLTCGIMHYSMWLIARTQLQAVKPGGKLHLKW